MSDDFLGQRRQALENSFFTQKNAELLNKLKIEVAAEERKQSLTAASGITDEAVLDEMVALNISSQTLAALSLAPLVCVAWADGKIQDAEREAMLKSAADAGIQTGDASYDLLQVWLLEQPGPELLQTWKDYIKAVCERLNDRSAAALKEDLIGRATKVADAAGGFLDLGIGNRISAEEQAVIDDLQTAFD